MIKYSAPYFCSICPQSEEGCPHSGRRFAGHIHACPNIEDPVVNGFGGVLNPPWNETFRFDPFVWILFCPEKIDDNWKVKYMISIHGVGSCGAVVDSVYTLALRKAREESLRSERLCDKQREFFADLFHSRTLGKFDAVSFSRSDVAAMEIEPADPQPKERLRIEDVEIIHVDFSGVGDQLELFA